MKPVEIITDPYEIYFPNLGWRFHINPTAFTIGNISVQWYGIIIAIGLIAAILYCMPKMKKFGLDPDRVIDVVIGGVIGGMIGARTYYVAMKWDEYKGDIKAILNFRNGGLAIYGGLIGAILIGLIICHFRKVRKLPMLDIASIGFLIGQGIGRWGNFVNQEAFGTNTDNLFAMTGGTIQQVIRNEAYFTDGDMYLNGLADMSMEYAVHPCFLYESVWCLLGVAVLTLIAKHRKFDGQVFLSYLIWYGSERFVVEGLRTDSLMFGSLRISQALSAVLVLTAVILMVVMMSRVRRDPERYVLYCNTEESAMLIEETRLKAEKAGSKKAENGNKSEESEDNKTDDSEKNNTDESNEKTVQEENENGTDN
ncbi:MAG: prolipoprotein diacylglyceryl transferase [Ruminococcus sp.]